MVSDSPDTLIDDDIKHTAIHLLLDFVRRHTSWRHKVDQTCTILADARLGRVDRQLMVDITFIGINGHNLGGSSMAVPDFLHCYQPA